MINTTTENHKNLDIVNSWNLVWFLSLNIVFCLWLIFNNFIHTPNDFYREVMNMLSYYDLRQFVIYTTDTLNTHL